MLITIENYKNISKLEMTIKNGAINSLFGISGCGKTSIAEALQGKDSDQNTKIGKK